MKEKEVKGIIFAKGGSPFTVKFISWFDREWTRTTRMLRESGADLAIPIVKR